MLSNDRLEAYRPTERVLLKGMLGGGADGRNSRHNTPLETTAAY
jgi:hypothetical protein